MVLQTALRTHICALKNDTCSQRDPNPSLVYKAIEPQQTTPLPPQNRWFWCSLLQLWFYLAANANLTCILRCFVNIFMMSYNVYVTFYDSIADSIADIYMLIEKRQVQPKGLGCTCLIINSELKQTAPEPSLFRGGNGVVC